MDGSSAAAKKGLRSFAHTDHGNWKLLADEAARLTRLGNHFAAGYVLDGAARGPAWGTRGGVAECLDGARREYMSCALGSAACSPEGIAALLQAARTYTLGAHNAESRERYRLPLADLADRLLGCRNGLDGLDIGGLLIRGSIACTTLEGEFRWEVPSYEVNWSSISDGPDRLRIGIPSAFQLYVYLGDYVAAADLAGQYPEAFSSPGLLGWREAVLGFVGSSTEREYRFAAAGAYFASDDSEEALATRGSWSSINVALWALHFKARSLLEKAVSDPSKLVNLLQEAATLSEEALTNWRPAAQVRFGVLLSALVSVLVDNDVAGARAAVLQLESETRWGSEDYDPLAQRFLILLAESLDGFRRDPVRELATGRLRDAIDAWERLPLFSDGFVRLIGPRLAEANLTALYGSARTWIHRSLEQLTDERQLQRIVLRLCQASLPIHAQITHGAFEYGKDVIAVEETVDGVAVRMYQMKLGNLSLTDWRRTYPQLEEMFLVELPDYILAPGRSPRRIGVLCTNGHLAASAFPVADGWLKSQRETYGREIEIMGVDRLVRWIEEDHLLVDFRLALRDEGIEAGPR